MANRTSAAARISDVDLDFEVDIDIELHDELDRPLDPGHAQRSSCPGLPRASHDRRRLRAGVVAGSLVGAAAAALAVGLVAAVTARVYVTSAERNGPSTRLDSDLEVDPAAGDSAGDAAQALLGREAEPPSGAVPACEAHPRTWLEPEGALAPLARSHPAGAEARWLGELAAAHPDLLWPGMHLAGVLASEGRSDDAVAVLDRVIVAHPGEEAALWMKSALLAPPAPRPVRAVSVPVLAPRARKPGLLPRKSSTQ